MLFFGLVVLLAAGAGCGGRAVDLEADSASMIEADGGVPRGDANLRHPDIQLPVDGSSQDAFQMGDPHRDLGGVAPGKWMLLPAGTYVMGAPKGEPCEMGYAFPHPVTLTHKIAISATEVTQGQFKTLMGYNPSHFKSCGSSCPVETISWHEAAAYCNALSQVEGLASCYGCKGGGITVSCSQSTAYSGPQLYACPGFRLPTEAEWEYAYRAGTTTTYYSGAADPAKCVSCVQKETNLHPIGWYCANSGNTPHPVGQKQPNAWGLFDMAGNVREWTEDMLDKDLGTSPVTDPYHSGGYRVVRGGSWKHSAQYLRAAYRYDGVGPALPTDRDNVTGFRCVRTSF